MIIVFTVVFCVGASEAKVKRTVGVPVHKHECRIGNALSILFGPSVGPEFATLPGVSLATKFRCPSEGPIAATF